MSFDQEEWLETHGLNWSEVEDSQIKLCWIDLESTGLDTDKDVILEFGLVLTDVWGDVIEDSAFHSLVWETSDHYRERLAAMDDFVRGMHERSGLLGELDKGPTRSINKVQADVLRHLIDGFEIRERQLYLAGNSVHFDAQLLTHYAYNFMQHLHYRQANVSTLKILCAELNPELFDKLTKQPDALLKPFNAHRSMSDLGDSINEYKAYIENFLWI